MRNVIKYLTVILLIGIATLSFKTTAAAAEREEGILVGRISHVEGKLLRYVEEEKDWVITVKDAPFGLDDSLYSEVDAKAEFIMPNETWIRVGENTQIQLIALNPDTTTIDVASGLARLYNKSRDTIVKVTTPFGYVVAPGDTVFDLYVGDQSMEVIAVSGDIDFVHDGTKTKYEVKEGGSSIIADRNDIALGNGTVDAAWDDWNAQRDRLWAKRLEVRGDSADFLPEPIREESYVLEENGRWERVYYQGAFHDMWRPTSVEPDWRPFTAGRWTVYYDDNCWIPDEPFGYVTHHYGSWVYVESFSAWYWAPPIRYATIGTPAISVTFGWYPGRVGWIHSGASVGWIPLAPNEVYYGHRHWGHHTVVDGRSKAVNISRYRYLNQAIIIPRDNLYRGTRYTPYLERNVNRTTIVNNYKPATVINNTVINNFNTDKHRFSYNDAEVTRKPHSSVLNRIDTNQKLSQDAGRISRKGIEQDLARTRTVVQPVQKTEIRTPKLTTKLVTPDKVAKPINEIALPQKEIKPKERERQLSPDNRPSLDRQRRGPRDQGQFNQGPAATGQDASRPIRSPRDIGTQRTEQATPSTSPQMEGKPRVPREQGQFEQGPGVPGQDATRHIRSPRETGTQGMEQATPNRPPQMKEPRAPQEQGRLDQGPETTGQDTTRHIRSPKDLGAPDVGQPSSQVQPASPRLHEQPKSQDLTREPQRTQDQPQKHQIEEPQRGQQLEMQQRQQQELQRQQQEQGLKHQQEEAQKRQQLEMQQRQQQELQRQQQEQGQKHQQEEAQRRQQLEMQQRQQQELQRQQQEQGLKRQQEEAQKRQQLEIQQRQQQELQRQQQEEAQRRQQQEMQLRQQQELQRQQQVEAQRRQQEEAQRRQQQEMQQRQQQEQQRQQIEAQRRQQQEEAQRRQQQEMQQRQQQEQQLQQQHQIQQQRESLHNLCQQNPNDPRCKQ